MSLCSSAMNFQSFDVPILKKYLEAKIQAETVWFSNNIMF